MKTKSWFLSAPFLITGILDVGDLVECATIYHCLLQMEQHSALFNLFNTKQTHSEFIAGFGVGDICGNRIDFQNYKINGKMFVTKLCKSSHPEVEGSNYPYRIYSFMRNIVNVRLTLTGTTLKIYEMQRIRIWSNAI